MKKYEIFKNGLISPYELLILYVVEEKKEIPLQELLNLFPNINIKNILKNLESKNMLKIDYENNLIINFNKSTVEVDVVENLTVDKLDQIRQILNREIKNYELEILKKWFEKHTYLEIKDAIQIASLKNIDNFNYINKILENSSNINSEKEEEKHKFKINRKFDFFK